MPKTIPYAIMPRVVALALSLVAGFAGFAVVDAGYSVKNLDLNDN